MKIGLVGEDPNDTSSIKNLLRKKYPKVEFINISGGQRGFRLDNVNKTKRVIESNASRNKINFIIYIRDMDSHEHDKVKMTERVNWFNALDKDSKNKGILLLNIHELEALILADIDSFNALFNIKIKFTKNPMFQVEPKEFLMDKTKKHSRTYHERDAPEIFNKLKIEEVIKKCKYFEVLIKAFEEKINA